MAGFELSEDKNYPDNDEYTPYVIGSSELAKKTGAKVVFWGKVTNIRPAYIQKYIVNTVDDKELNIVLKEKPSEHLAKGWYEFYGTVAKGNKGAITVCCDGYVQFSEEMTQNMDRDGHIKMVKLLAALDDPWDLGTPHKTET